ncbi:MAG: ADOP family duplicated permease [Gemmatimonadaceae bacterium]
MPDKDGALTGRLARLELERKARALGLPELLAKRVAEVVVASELDDDRRGEVFREMVAHFEDGLAAGRSPEQLAQAFGDSRQAARMIRAEKRVVTPEEFGGTGARESFPARLGRDLRYAVRRLAARPVFTAIAVLSLAIGIGANAAMFTLVNEVILRRPPLERPEELVDIFRSSQDSPFDPISYPEYLDVASRTDVFSSVSGTRLLYAVRMNGDRADRLAVQLVSGNYFQTLGLHAARGRLIQPDDADAPGKSPVVVLTDRYWRQSFNADPSVVGKTIHLGGGDYTIIGVTRPDFPSGFPTLGIQLFAPAMMIDQLMPSNAGELQNRHENSTFTRARLRPGVTLAQARTSMAALGNALHERKEVGWEGATAYTVLPTRDVILYPPIDKLLRPVAWVMMGVVGMVLLIACANLAGFLLARAVDRRKEVAVRLALGATQGRLVFQLLVETLLLAAIGGAVGLWLGRAALKAVLAADLPIPVPLGIDLNLDVRVLSFLIVVSVVAGIAFGLAPALQSTRLELAAVIREESTGGGRSNGWLRQGLVAAQVAVSVVLLIAAGLFVRSVQSLRNVDPGFGRQPSAMVWLGMPATQNEAEAARRLDLMVRRLASQPEVKHVGLIDNMHLNLLSFTSTDVNVDGVQPPPGEIAHSISRASIDTGFVAAAGLRLLAGRNFTVADFDTTRRVALVNEAFGQKFWPGQDPVGHRYRSTEGRETEIIGVVNTVKVRTLAEPPRPLIYTPLRDRSIVWMLVDGSPNSDAQLAGMLRVIRDVSPDAMVMEARTMARHMEIMSLPLKLGANALAAFALLALLLASIGLYGTVSYSVAQRSREVGIRLSLGATPPAVIRLLLWDGVRLVVVGAVGGMVLGLLFGRALQGILYGVTATDPATLAAVPVVLVLVAALAAYVPARRAGRIDPVVAIKSE